MSFDFPLLYPILDASFLPFENRPEFLKRLIPELADAGVTLLQYRNKDGSASEILADAAVMRAVAPSSLQFIMNDSPELAVQADFDGVHVGQEDISPAEARQIVGDYRIIGISTHNQAQLEMAASMPVDYVAVGPVFATVSKKNPDPVIGLEGVREAWKLARKPLVAIGGITLENAPEVIAAGADTVAVISALFGTGKNPAALAGEFLERLR